MNDPDLKLDGLAIWVDRRQFPDQTDYWDGNWLDVMARMEAPGATVKCDGSILMTTDFERFRSELVSLQTELSGAATLGGYEPNLKVVLKMQNLGHVDCDVEITPDHLGQFHRFSIELDQTYLPSLIASCEAVLERFPIRGASD